MHRFARPLLIVALIAVLLRAIVPAGYMPEMHSGKTFQMTICSMEGPKTITVDDKFQPVKNQKHQAKETCPFSIAHHVPFNAMAVVAGFDAPYQVSVQQRFIARDRFVRSHVYNIVAQPRAPPVIA